MDKMFKQYTERNINYYPPSELAFDDFIFCNNCTEYVLKYCSIHGPLLVIPDEQVPAKPNIPAVVPRAALTIPHNFLHLARSTIPGAGIGVFSTISLPCDVSFGPYQGTQTNQINSNYCWQIYDNNKQPIYVIDAMDANRSNWMRYVNCARHWCEQNLIAYQYRGQIYYRTIKTIPKNTELMVFYGSEFANALNINLKKYNEAIFYTDVINPSHQASGNESSEKLRKNLFLDNEETYFKKSAVDTSDTCSTFYDAFAPSSPSFWGTSSPITEETTPSTLVENSPDFIISDLIAYEDLNIDQPNLTSHSLNKIETNVFPCDACEKIFKHKKSLTRHRLSHLKVRNTAHIVNLNKPTLLICDVCKKQINHRSLQKHKLTHLPIKRYHCNLCEFKTNMRYTLTDHMGRHTKEFVFYCHICAFQSYSKIALRSHIKRCHNSFMRFL